MNNHFAPEIEWDKTIHKINDTSFGLLYVQESLNKPVMCIKNDSGDIKESEIYYRYRGRSECIKYPELRSIIEIRRENEQKLWLSTISRIARIGVRDAGIIDINTGLVTGQGSGSFLIDESLLSQISFIKEGEFSEVKGKPTLKLIGDLRAMDNMPILIGQKQIIKTKGIYASDIILNFLEQKSVSNPQDFLESMCHQTTSTLPLYYYLDSSKKDVKTTVEIFNNVISRTPAKKRIIDRLNNKTLHGVPFRENNTEASKKKKEHIAKIKANQVQLELESKDLKFYLQAILGLSAEEIKQFKDVILPALKHWFNKYYSNAPLPVIDLLRRTICWVDEALYIDKCQ